MKTKRKSKIRATRSCAPSPGSATVAYRVYVEQVNQTYVEVRAKNPEEAAEKGYRKWRRDYAHARVSWVESPNR